MPIQDTRHTRKLLSFFGLSSQLHSFHEHNEHSKEDQVEQSADLNLLVGTEFSCPGLMRSSSSFTVLCPKPGCL